MLRVYTSYKPSPSRIHASLGPARRVERPSFVNNAPLRATLPTSVWTNVPRLDSVLVQKRFRFKTRRIPVQFKQIMKPDHLRENWVPTARQYLSSLVERPPVKQKRYRKKTHAFNPYRRVSLDEVQEAYEYHMQIASSQSARVDTETEQLRAQQVQAKLDAIEAVYAQHRSEYEQRKQERLQKKAEKRAARAELRAARREKRAQRKAKREGAAAAESAEKEEADAE